MDRKSELLTILASTEESVDTYSSTMRELNKNDPKKIQLFMKKFKDAFDNVLDQGLEDNHQDIALEEARASYHSRFVKLAQAAVGTSNNPNEVGKTVAEIVRVILARVPQEKDITYDTMRKKILSMNVAEISGTTLPDTAAYGQALTLIKTLLSGYAAEFVQQVLVSASNNL
ncbi:hypothetical protein LCGC14_0390120 [marine sediment metagenome]|uniref:Uncharacterized protein n=1 Tax=marine sediment metagenome TaxID=412755 RepID=A0A0F9SZY2_9ZZZZ